MKIEIKHRWTDSVLWECEAESLKEAVEKAVAAGANLESADLRSANLVGANLESANLVGADLESADLRSVDLESADLRSVDLESADLRSANLVGADLESANLVGANLVGANLESANLVGADLESANLESANLVGANLVGADLRSADRPAAATTESQAEWRKRFEGRRAQLLAMTREERMLDYRARHPEVPVIENLDSRILESIDCGAMTLDMGSWHGQGRCGTTHCRAGGAIHLAGQAGYDLEEKVRNPAIAGAMIYRASTGRVPNFYARNDVALADIRRCAAEETGDVP